MRIKEAEERSEIDIPISEVVGEGGKLNILPNVKKYFSVDYKPKNDQLSLVAGGYIGLIPVTASLAVEVKPKFSISNLTRMVSLAEDRFNTLSFFYKNYGETEESKPLILEFMAECLVNELRTLQQEGLLKEYVLRKEDQPTIRGRININDSIKLLWSHGHFNKVSVSYFDFTPDNIFNRLIKYSIEFCIQELRSIDSAKVELVKDLIEFHSLFGAVGSVDNEIVFDEAFSSIKNKKVTTLRYYYANICELCRLIIGRRGVNFDRAGNDLALSSFTLDMAQTFEKYLLNSLRHNRSVFGGEVSILDGNKEGKKKFYNQPSHAQADAKPDIIVKSKEAFSLIADAKYKLSSKEADKYQVISHAVSYGAKHAVLILPKRETYTGKVLVELGSLGPEKSVRVYEYYFDLSSEDLPAQEVMLAEALAGIIAAE